jgi:tRNA nucleotidyltransferase (CCA-adding enzyme)
MDLNRVIEKIKPGQAERKEMNDFIEKLLETTKKISSDVKPMICGSVEKDTWLSKKYELDLFLLFNPDVDKKVLEEKGLGIAKKVIKSLKGRYQISFAEHPYLRGWVKKFQMDIVPCYDIENPEKIKSAVDRTPHHVKFVKKNLKNPDDVRLLKQFCISNKCYGADVKTLGFSGYLCELLIINYGSFLDCVKDASRWRAGRVVTFDNLNNEDARKKFKSALVVVDPVDKNRNVGAAVSIEKFYTFVKACKEFTESPKEVMFFRKKPKPYSIKQIGDMIKKRKTDWYLLSFEKPEVIDDILYPQMKRCCNSISKMLAQQGFKVLGCDFYCNKECAFVFEMEVWHIPKVSKSIGPDVYSVHAEQFLKHYKKDEVFIEDEKWVVEIENKFTEVFEFLSWLIKQPKNELSGRGIPSKIVPVISKANLSEGDLAVRSMKKLPEDFRIFLREYFEKNLNVV